MGLTLITAVGIFTPGCESGGDDDDSGLGAPTLISPSSGTVYSHFPRTTTLVWSTVEDATSYIVEVQYDGGSWSTLVSTEVSGTTHTFNFVGAQPGRWRVQAKAADGSTGAWTAYSGFEYSI